MSAMSRWKKLYGSRVSRLGRERPSPETVRLFFSRGFGFGRSFGTGGALLFDDAAGFVSAGTWHKDFEAERGDGRTADRHGNPVALQNASNHLCFHVRLDRLREVQRNHVEFV